jgi:RNA polymerase sigma-70 factor (ECF subfamily)
MAGRLDDTMRDRQLVSNFLLHREESSFRELYRKHAPSLNQMIVRFVGGFNGDAEDVIQTTWIRAIEHMADFRWESSLRTWLTGIALNCAREHLRKRKRVQKLDFIDKMDHTEVPRVNHEINRIDLERAIAVLPDGYREVLILHDIEGYTHEEIGGLMGIEPGTSKSQLSRARKAVRMILTATDGYGDERKTEQRIEQRRKRGIPHIGGDAISFSK